MSVTSATLAGNVVVTASYSASAKTDIEFAWTPSSGACLPGVSGSCYINTGFGNNPTTGDYSFTWPTQKFLDGSGTLIMQVVGSTVKTSIGGLTLANGNSTGILPQYLEPNDWSAYLPPTGWSQSTDPTAAAAVGDGADGLATGNGVASSIASTNPPLFLYLGDVYERGSYSEMLNHYGWNAMDGTCTTVFTSAQCASFGTWGQLAPVTQPTIGNHELDASATISSQQSNGAAWQDYWHGRPLYTTYVFANTRFIDLNCGPSGSGCAVGQGTEQYDWLKNVLQTNTYPCVVAYWHIPVVAPKSTGPPSTNLQQLWSLLVNNGATLALNGHVHSMGAYKPLNDQLQIAGPGEKATTELIIGSGGRSRAAFATDDPRVAWGLGGVQGVLYFTLNGAANRGTPSSITYSFQSVSHNTLFQQTVPCAGGSAPPPTGPQIQSFSPTSGPVGTAVTITGSGFTGANDVKFNGTSVGSGNFSVNGAGTQITTAVPQGASTGPITVFTPNGNATSASNFQVTTPPPPPPPSGISYVGTIGTVTNTSGAIQTTLSVSAGSGGVAAGNTIVLGLAAQNAVSVESVTDDAGNAYNVDVVNASSGTGACTTALMSARVTNALSSGQKITVTLSGKGNTWGFTADVFSGLSGTVDRTGKADSGGAKTTSASVSTASATTQADEAVIGVTCANAWPGISAGAGYSLLHDLKMVNTSANRELADEYKVVSATGTQTAAFGLGKAQTWSAVVGTYPSV